MLLFDRA